MLLSKKSKIKRALANFNSTQSHLVWHRLWPTFKTSKVLMDCKCSICYLDDIIIFSQTVEEHLEPIRIIFESL